MEFRRWILIPPAIWIACLLTIHILGAFMAPDTSEIPSMSSQNNQDYYSIDISETLFSGQHLRLSFRGNFGAELGGNNGKIQLSAVQFYGWEDNASEMMSGVNRDHLDITFMSDWLVI